VARQLRVAVDRTACDGNAMCAVVAPNTFDIDDLNQSTVRDPGGDPEALVLEAAANCPVRAISVADAETGAQLFP